MEISGFITNLLFFLLEIQFGITFVPYNVSRKCRGCDLSTKIQKFPDNIYSYLRDKGGK